MLPQGCRTVFSVRIVGHPEPCGSKRSFVPLHPRTRQPFRDAHGRIVVNTIDANENAKGWKDLVAAAAREKWGARKLLDQPLAMVAIFRSLRPKSHYGSGRNADKLSASAPDYPVVKPDALKLMRGVEDALTGVVYKDDARIVLEVIRKEFGTWEGVEVLIATMPKRARINHGTITKQRVLFADRAGSTSGSDV